MWWLCMPVCVCAHGGQRTWIPWNWSYRRLWATWHGCWELNSILCKSNIYWAILLVPPPWSLASQLMVSSWTVFPKLFADKIQKIAEHQFSAPERKDFVMRVPPFSELLQSPCTDFTCYSGNAVKFVHSERLGGWKHSLFNRVFNGCIVAVICRKCGITWLGILYVSTLTVMRTVGMWAVNRVGRWENGIKCF